MNCRLPCRHRALSLLLFLGMALALVTGRVVAQTGEQPENTPGIAGRTFAGNPLSLLGMTPADVLGSLGAPPRVYAVRGAESWQDDVVFDYDGGIAVFLFGDRVWQVRVSGAQSPDIQGASPGMTADAVSSLLGDRGNDADGYREWSLHGQAWPLRLRALIGADGLVTELYAYRADF